MIDFVSVGKKIMFYRKKLNLTQDELVNKLFVLITIINTHFIQF